MNTSFFDVLENTANVNILAITQSINVTLDSTFKEAVEIDRMIRSNASSFCHVLLKVLSIICNNHATTAKNVARTNKQREADAIGNLAGFLKRRSHTRSRIRNRKLIQNLGEAIAIFSKIDGLGLSAHDVNTRILKSASELQRRLPTKGNHYPIRLLDINNVHYVFVSQRLKIKTIRRVVVS